MILRKLRNYLLLPITSVLCLLTIMLSSPWGSEATIHLVNKFSPVELTYRQGAILQEIEFTQAKLAFEQLTISATNIKLHVNFRCLWKGQLCIDDVSANALAIQQLASHDSSNSALQTPNNANKNIEKIDDKSSQSQFIEFPFFINIKKLNVNNTLLNLPQATIKLSQLNSAVKLQNSSLVLGKSSVAFIDVKTKTSALPIPQAGHISTSANISLPPSALQLPVQVTLTELIAKKINVELFDAFTFPEPLPKHYTLTNTALGFEWAASKITLKKLVTTYASLKANADKELSKEFGQLSASGHLTLTEQFPVHINLSSKINHFPYWPSLENSEQKLDISGDLQKLALKLESTGSLGMKATANVQPLETDMPFELTLNATKIPLDLLDSLQNSDEQLLVKPSSVKINASGDRHQQTIELEGFISAFGYDNAAIELETIHSNKSLAIRSLEFTDEKSASALSLEGNIDYLDNIQWDISIDSSGFTLPKLYSDLKGRLTGTANSQGNIQGNIQDKHWSFALSNTNLHGIINDKDFRATGNIHVSQNKQISPSNFHASLGETTLNLAGYSDDAWHINGDVKAFELKDWLNEGQGELTGLFEISGELADPVLTFDGNIKQISWRQLFGQEISIHGQYALTSKQLLALSLNSDELRWSDLYFNNFTSQFSNQFNSQVNQQSLQLNWQGEKSLALAIQGRWLEENERWQGEITSASVGISHLQLNANEPISLDFNTNNQQLIIGAHCWLADEIQLCADKAAIIGQSGELSFALLTELSQLNSLWPNENILLDSKLSGNIHLQWHDLLTPTLQAELTLGQGHASLLNFDNEQGLIHWQEGRFNLISTSENIKSQLTLFPVQEKEKQQEQAQAQTQEQAKIQALTQDEALNSNTNNKAHSLSLPLPSPLPLPLPLPSPIISAVINMPIDADEQLSGKIQLQQLNLQPVAHFFPELSSLEALVNADITLAGTAKTPLFYGALELKDSKIKLLRSPSMLENINLQVKLEGNHSQITSDFLIDKNRVTATGKVDWQDHFSADIFIDADKVSLAFPPQLQATFSPHIQVNLTKNQVKITGEMDIVDGLLTIEKLPEGSIDVSDDVVIIDDLGQPIITSKRMNSAIDLHITLAEKFKLIGQGYDGHIGGELQLKQENSQPIQLFGVLKLIDGKYKAYGQRLAIDKGVLSFNGPTNTPLVDLRATKKIEKEDVSVGVTITGLTNALELKLFSTPNMPQTEILSYLVRGRGLDAETQGNTALGVALGTSLASASGVLKQFDKLPLINNVELDSTDEQLTIGGYIGEKIYVKYGKGLLEPINELQVRFYLLNRLWLEAVTGLERSAGIFYSFDIK